MYDSIIFTDSTENMAIAKPLGAYKCAHVLRENGYSCLVVDHFHAFTEKELKQLISMTVSEKTKFIGFSNTFLADSSIPKNADGSTPTYPLLKNGRVFPQGNVVEDNIILFIKQLQPSIKIIVGGARSNPNESNRNIDYVFIGYSEVSIVNFMNHLSRGDILTNATKNIFGRIIIDDRKAPDYNFADSSMIWLPSDVVNHKVLPLEIGRGCIFKCKFCSFPMNGKQQLDFVRSEKQLMYELEKNYNEYGIFRYQIVDDTFNDNDYKLDIMLAGIKKLKFQPEFWAYTRLDLLARSIDTNFQKLYDIGLRATFFGFETLNEETGRIVGKGYSRQRQIEAVQHIRNKYKDTVSMHGTFIIGLPKETEESCRNTFQMLLSQELPLHSWRWYGLYIAKTKQYAWNSEFMLNYEKYGYKETKIDDDSNFINWQNEYTTFDKALALAEEFNQLSEQGNHMCLPNLFGWSLCNLGYDPTFTTTHSLSQINANELEKKSKRFRYDYKKQLFDLLKK